ncbi:hypothetical protein ACFVKB_16390 [Rhodococcus sp. NPDC127530]
MAFSDASGFQRRLDLFLAGDGSRFMTGQTICVNGGVSMAR